MTRRERAAPAAPERKIACMHWHDPAPLAAAAPTRRRAVTWLRGTIAAVALLAAGCGPSVRPAELGHVVYDPAELPGADEPYPLPQLERQPGEIIRGEKPAK